MEIDITDFFETAEPWEFSHSCAESGPNAGPNTWAAALRQAEESPLLATPKALDAMRAWAKASDWDDQEIAAWSNAELNALFIQIVSGDMREAGLDNDPDEDAWNEYTERAEAGNCSGNLFRANGRIYYGLEE
jgi:hypothetical protein